MHFITILILCIGSGVFGIRHVNYNYRASCKCCSRVLGSGRYRLYIRSGFRRGKDYKIMDRRDPYFTQPVPFIAISW